MKKAFRVRFPQEKEEQGTRLQDTDEVEMCSKEPEVTAEDIDDETLWEDLEEEDEEAVFDIININSKKRLSCFAHSLQLVIGDGLKETRGTGIESVILKACKLSALLHWGTIFKERYFDSKDAL